MSKKLIFAVAAVLGMVACSQERIQTPVSEDANGGAKFRIAMNRPTTKAEIYYNSAVNVLDGSTSPSLGIRAVASFVNTSGEMLFNDYFVTGSGASTPGEPTLGYLKEYATDEWYIFGSDVASNLYEAVQFPFGNDVRMNALFLAAPNDGAYSELSEANESTPIRYWGDADDAKYQSAANGGWDNVGNASWYPVFSDDTDFTKKVDFINVDTYANKMDLMYTSSNNIKAGETKTIVFDHAQAVVIFNLNISNWSEVNGSELYTSTSKVALLYVDPEAELTSDPSKKLKDVLTTPGFDASMLADEITAAGDVAKFLTLKSVGTFTVDNSRNTLVASWDLSKWGELANYYTVIQDGIRNNNFQYARADMELKSGSQEAVSHGNPNHPNATVEGSQGNFFPMDWAYPLGTICQDQSADDEYVQVGMQLVPEQETVNPWLLYTPDGGDHIFLKEVNIPRGTWQKGHAYIYNISFPLNATAKFTVNVTPYVVDGPFDI